MSDQTQINCRACGEPMDYVTWDWNGRDMSIVTCRNESCACAGATFTAASYASKDLRPYGYQGN